MTDKTSIRCAVCNATL
ncbi:hypothetical protein FS593_15195 [Lelliottia amnigena]|nr:hypothetical protein FS593_15195 [Lelliottia amnigena]